MSSSRSEDSARSPIEATPPLVDREIAQAAKGGAATSRHSADDLNKVDSLLWFWRQANQQLVQVREELKLEQQRRQVLAERKTQLETEVSSLRQQLEAGRLELEQARLDQGRSERELASLQAGWKHLQQEKGKLENERAARLRIERRLALLDTQSDKALELAGQLARERNLRLKLEREKGMLLNELKSRREVEAHLQALTEENSSLRGQLLEQSPRAAQLEIALTQVNLLESMLAEEKTVRLSSDVRAANALARLARLQGEMDGRQASLGRSLKPQATRHWLSRLLFD